MYLLAVRSSHVRLKWLLQSSHWWLCKVLLHHHVCRSLAPGKRQQQTKGALPFVLERLPGVLWIPLWEIPGQGRKARACAEDAVVCTKCDYSPFFFICDPTVMPDLNRIRRPPKFISFPVPEAAVHRDSLLLSPCRRLVLGVILWEIKRGDGHKLSEVGVGGGQVMSTGWGALKERECFPWEVSNHREFYF